MPWRWRPSVRRPFVKRVFSETISELRPNLWKDSYPPYLLDIFPVFQNFGYLKFNAFFYSVNMGRYGNENFKMLLLLQLIMILFQSNLF